MQLRSRISLFLVALLVLPSLAQAKMSAHDALQTPDNEVVSRGEFIRAAVIVLGLEDMVVDERHDLPYRRVAKGVEKYVRIAHKKNALESFEYDLLLARGISRGQALRVLVNLTGLDTPNPAPFKDVKVGTPDERAVRVAVDRNWMSPIRENLFGIRRVLTGSEARLLLRKVSGEQGAQDSTFQQSQPTIKVNLGQNKRLMNLPKTQILEALWSVIERDYLYTDKIDTDEAAWKAAEGLVESLDDKYTTFMRPLRSKQFQAQIQGEITGIGAQVEYLDGILTIVSPLKGSPAEAAGLEPGDQVLKVDGEELSGLSFMEAVEKVRGPKGSKVKLTIRRNGFELDVDVVRDVIRVPDGEIKWHDDVVVVQLHQFGRVAQEELRPDMEEAMKQNPKGVVLDLRKNPGGLLSAANTVISIFLPEGTPYVQVRSRKDEKEVLTHGEQIVPNAVPMVVLINEGSASASEIVAGALQDTGRATVVGSKSFGKGTVQQVRQFSDSSSLKLTIAEWYTPNGTKIDGVGISPDIGVSEVDGRDAPLLKALELLR